MAWLTTLKRLLRREADDAREILDDVERNVARVLDEKERDLAATPEQRLDAAVADAAAADAALDEIARDIAAKPAAPPDSSRAE